MSMPKNKSNRRTRQTPNRRQPDAELTARRRRQESNGVGHSAISREPTETDGAPMDWRRVLFAGVGAAFVTVLIVYVLFHLFGLAAGLTEGDITNGETATGAAQNVSSWSTLILSVLLTFVAALWSVRQTAEKHLLQGLFVGIISAILIVGPLIGFLGGELDGFSIATFLLTIGAGVVAGLFGNKGL